MPSGEYLALSDRAFLKRLEFPAVYETARDDLYEVDECGFEELSRCDGTLSLTDSEFPAGFLTFCLEEGLLCLLQSPSARTAVVGVNESPSLRYLMLEITERCNLRCRHCYLGEPGGCELSVKFIRSVADQCDRMGVLRLIITGGEPVMHPEFFAINDILKGRSFRSVLVTNGTLIDGSTAVELAFDEVQVSLDGMSAGHDLLRGKGSFSSAMRAVDLLLAAGKQVSVATMVHSGNLDELDELEGLLLEKGIMSWALDVPCPAGRMSPGSGITPDYREAARHLSRSFGAEHHQPSGGYACGAHLACVRADGVLAKCGFYRDWTGGTVERGLREAWLALPRMRLDELECDCSVVEECGGGCRFRAETQAGRSKPDPLRCMQMGVEPPR